MADISKITLPDNSEYNIKDATARSIANGKSTVSVSQTLTSGTEIGSVTVDGTATKLYAPQGGSADALTDTEIEAAVDDAFPAPTGKTVQIFLTEPSNASGFDSFQIDEVDSDGNPLALIGSIDSPNGSTSFVLDGDYIGVRCNGAGPYMYKDWITMSEGITLLDEQVSDTAMFEVLASGSITIKGINWDW